MSVNLLSTLLSSLANQISSFLNTGEVPKALGIRHSSVVPYETIATADGTIAIAVGTDRQFTLLCKALGLSELVGDPRFTTNSARVVHHDELLDILDPVFRTRSSADRSTLFTDAGIPAGPVNDLSAAVELAKQLGLDPIVQFPILDHESISTVKSALEFSDTPISYRFAPPGLGADDAEVLNWLEGNVELSP